MIGNLNQLSFQGFGTISPERSSYPECEKPEDRLLVALSQGTSPVYVCSHSCWINYISGMTALSVSADGKEFFHYYLDKPVRILPGIRFSLSAIRGEATAELFCPQAPRIVDYQDPSEALLVRKQLQVETIYTFFYQEKEQAFFFPGEVHPMLELTYVDRGSVHSVADGRDLLLEQGDLVIYGPDQWHMQYADIGVAPRFVTVSFDISGQLSPALFNRKIRAPQAVLTMLQQMLREQEQMPPLAGDMLLLLLNQLLIALQRDPELSAQKPKPSHILHSDNEIIRRAQQYVSTHVRQKLTVPLVARQVDVSPSYLTALFHKHLQIAPGEYIRRIKLQESKQLIRENSMNFTQIASALQYSTVHHFSRQFKEKFGMTPSEYARSVR